MDKYIKDGKIIYATEKAYNIIYKEKGYKPLNETIEPKNECKNDIINYDKMTKEELIKIANEIGIEVDSNATKKVILALIKDTKENKEEADN